MPKIMFSLPQRQRLCGVRASRAPHRTLSFIINMIVRPCRSTLRLSTGGSRRVEFLNFRHFRSF
jgi:hypothetical protein